jgi:hypothetical protein
MTSELLDVIGRKIQIVLGTLPVLSAAFSETLTATDTVTVLLTPAVDLAVEGVVPPILVQKTGAQLYPEDVEQLEALYAEGESEESKAARAREAGFVPHCIQNTAGLWEGRMAALLYPWTGQRYLFPYQRALQRDIDNVDYGPALEYLRGRIDDIKVRMVDTSLSTLRRLLVEGERLAGEAADGTAEQLWADGAWMAEVGNWHLSLFGALVPWRTRQSAFARIPWMSGSAEGYRPNPTNIVNWLRGLIVELEAQQDA